MDEARYYEPGVAHLKDSKIMTSREYDEWFEERQRYDLYTINFTITWNPNKFADSDTLWDAPQFFAKYIKKQKSLVECRFTIEKHPMRPTRWHIHGQLDIRINVNDPLKRFNVIENVSKWCSAKCGNSKFTWNNESWESQTQYATYWDYCLKESTSYYTVNTDPNIDKLLIPHY